MDKIEASFRLTTPLFMGGGPKKSADIKSTGLKGALRFWWRALAYHRHQGNIVEMFSEEEQIFGSTSRQARILLLPIQYDGRATDDVDKMGKRHNGYGLSYLGRGPIKMGKNSLLSAEREFFPPGKNIIVRIASRCEDNTSVIAALRALGTFGGIGSRSRRGFGSVSLTEIKQNGQVVWSTPHDQQGLQDDIHDLLRASLQARFPKYSAFSSTARVYWLEQGDSAIQLLDRVGQQMQLYRSFGRGGRVGGKTAERNFKDDHDAIWNAIDGKQMHVHPRRIVFGLPQNYQFSSESSKKVQPSIVGTASGRRASPFFIHIHAIDNQYVALATILPADFLPGGERIQIQKTSQAPLPVNVDWNVLYDFIEKGPGLTDGWRFTEGRVLWP